MKTTVQILRDAKALLETKGWAQGNYYQREDGSDTYRDDPQACRFCGLGALRVASLGKDVFNSSDARGALIRTVAGEWSGFPAFNDAPGRTLAEVLAKFDEAIAAEEAREAAPAEAA